MAILRGRFSAFRWRTRITLWTASLPVGLTRRWAPHAQGSGIPRVIATTRLAAQGRADGHLISLRIALTRICLGTPALIGGFSVGREGPSVQVAASILQAAYRWLPHSRALRAPDLILAGGAAGIAAASNTSLAGIAFAVEELGRKLETRTSAHFRHQGDIKLSKRWLWLLAIPVIILFAVDSHYITRQDHQPPLPKTSSAVQASPTPTPVEVSPPPKPPPEQPAPIAAPTLPSLDSSDALAADTLVRLVGRDTFLANFYSDKIIRRIVATIDNLPRHQAPQAVMPVKPTGGKFLVDAGPVGLTIGPANAERYDGYVNMIQSMDVASLVDTYIRLYPLFQQAYRDLGYPKGFFQDRVAEALDDLLATPDVSEPVSLVQPKVFYAYSDPTLESRSAGQRILMRIGNDNATKIKVVLQAIRAELARRMSKR